MTKELWIQNYRKKTLFLYHICPHHKTIQSARTSFYLNICVKKLHDPVSWPVGNCLSYWQTSQITLKTEKVSNYFNWIVITLCFNHIRNYSCFFQENNIIYSNLDNLPHCEMDRNSAMPHLWTILILNAFYNKTSLCQVVFVAKHLQSLLINLFCIRISEFIA